MSDAVPFKSAVDAQWWVQIRGRIFGPYCIEQMARFMTEGRVKPNTMVSANGKDKWTEARRIMALRGLRTPAPANDGADAANVFIHVEIFSGAWHRFMAELEGMGRLCEMAPGLWLLRTTHSVSVIRNALSQTLERGDRFVVIDATRDRLAWFNLGPETDVRIGTVWNRPLPLALGGAAR